MQKGYEIYCLADPLFYDAPELVHREEEDFAAARRPVPAGWRRSELDDWVVYAPQDARLPSQGWKIHASACLDCADEVVCATCEHCIPRGITFKFIRSLELYFLRNTKYAHRGASGKLVTIYPRDEAELEAVLSQLGATLAGRPGPYILSDLRYGTGPLYVRYGGFADRHCIGEDGTVEPAIADPGGRLVPDRRGPTFQPPPWVTLPAFLEPHLAARNATRLDDLPYRIEHALHFSNGGGVYRGVDRRTGEPVVLKEARPHAGLAWDAADAVTRLERERAMLERLAGLDVVPALRDHFTLGEHHFLVEEFIDGRPLRELLVRRYPLSSLEIDENAAAEYASWALDVHRRVEQAVAAVHERGVVIGDFHPYNVLVCPDGRVVLIDLEEASEAARPRRSALHAPGFLVPRECTGFAADHYALACLKLFMFLPLTQLLALAPSKAAHLAAEIAEVVPVPAQSLDQAVRVITAVGTQADGQARAAGNGRPSLAPDAAGWRRARDSMARAILASATPQRRDRLFPGDVAQFRPGGGLGLAYGAAGVLYALDATGAGRHPEHEEWLVRRAGEADPGVGLGFYEGLHGVAYVLERLGRREDALRALDVCLAEVDGRWERLSLDLYGGLAGIGLNLAHFAAATGDASLWEAADRIVEVVAGRLGGEDDVATVSGGRHSRAGLLAGSAGPALLFLRLYERSGDSGLLDLAATALRQDLRRCRVRDDGSMEVNEGWRTTPYLSGGSVGIGLVLEDYLALREDERFAQAAAAIRLAAQARFYVEPGLFFGRAGMILHLSRGRRAGVEAPHPVAAAHVRRLAWHALTYRGHMAFPGQELLRLSMDLATGTAGVMLAVGAALHDRPVRLPLLESLCPSEAADVGDLQLTAERR